MSPEEEYTSRLAGREATLRRLERLQKRVGGARLLLAAMALVLAGLSWGEHWLSALWLLVPVAGFAGAVAYHAVLRRCQDRARRAAELYRAGLARLQERWAGGGNRGERFADGHHVYSADLDLFGEGSLFELLSGARTRMGEETLAAWLSGPATIAEVQQRQLCLQDLRHRLDLRERIGFLGSEREPALYPGRLLAWAEAPAELTARWIAALAYLLPAGLLAALIAGDLTGLWSPVALLLLIEGVVWYRLRERVRRVLFPAERAFDFDGLTTFAGLLLELEREGFESAPLRSLSAALACGARPASSLIRRLATLVMLSEQRLNPIVGALQVPLMYLPHVALAVERWRRANGPSVRGWMEAVGRFEALASLARYSFEHPQDPFPRFLDGRAALRAQALGHPLIPRAQCVCNDVSLCDPTRIWLVSGSNMSGKSTLLRAVGLNVVLAMAGAPVRARDFELTPLQLGASIRINDSLREGSSRFYAEITRLRELKELAGRDPPLLFLIDEILQGTHSNDRRIGAQAVLGALIGLGSIGLASTHDLALTELPGLGEGVMRNVHFEDHLENGRMRFDYRLREGVVTKSNGLELMRAIGLRV
jgi:MutS domain V